MPLKEITDAFTIGRAGLTLFEYIKGLDAKVAVGEIASQLADLRVAHLDVANRYVEAVAARVQAETERDELRGRIEDVASLIHDQNVYWRVVDGRRIGPFCPACRHLDLPKVVPMSERVGIWHCPSCKHKEDTPQRLRDLSAPVKVRSDFEPY